MFTLFVISIVLSNIKIVISDDPLLEEAIDQSQGLCYNCEYFENYAWQEFVPTMTDLVRVEVCVAQFFGGSPDLTLSIERPLGNNLTSKTLPVSAIPSGECGWVSFDIPDISTTLGESYYIVLSFPPGGEYGWCNAWENPYQEGNSNIDYWDYCFRTVGHMLPSNSDLVMTNVWNEDGVIWYQISNVGNGTAPPGHYTALYIDGTYVASDFIATALDPGVQLARYFDYNWVPTPPDDYIEVVADYRGDITESNEVNNQKFETWEHDGDGNWVIIAVFTFGGGTVAAHRVYKIRKKKKWQKDAKDEDPPKECQYCTHQCKKQNKKLKGKYSPLKLKKFHISCNNKKYRIKGKVVDSFNNLIMNYNEGIDSKELSIKVEDLSEKLLRSMVKFLKKTRGPHDVSMLICLEGCSIECEFILKHCKRVGSVNKWIDERSWKATVKEEIDEKLGILKNIELEDQQSLDHTKSILKKLVSNFLKRYNSIDSNYKISTTTNKCESK